MRQRPSLEPVDAKLETPRGEDAHDPPPRPSKRRKIARGFGRRDARAYPRRDEARERRGVARIRRRANGEKRREASGEPSPTPRESQSRVRGEVTPRRCTNSRTRSRDEGDSNDARSCPRPVVRFGTSRRDGTNARRLPRRQTRPSRGDLLHHAALSLGPLDGVCPRPERDGSVSVSKPRGESPRPRLDASSSLCVFERVDPPMERRGGGASGRASERLRHQSSRPRRLLHRFDPPLKRAPDPTETPPT